MAEENNPNLQSMPNLQLVASNMERFLQMMNSMFQVQRGMLDRQEETLQAIHRTIRLQEEMLRQLQRMNTAMTSLEWRAMMAGLTGAEAGRLVMLTLQAYMPHGPAETWQQWRCRRQILEIMAAWKRSCENSGVVPWLEHWNLVVEAGLRHALEELPAETQNSQGETVRLEDKIQFWRDNIPEARGIPEAGNLLVLQRHMQMDASWSQRPPSGSAVLYGDLVDWRQADLHDYASQVDSAGSPLI